MPVSKSYRGLDINSLVHFILEYPEAVIVALSKTSITLSASEHTSAMDVLEKQFTKNVKFSIASKSSKSPMGDSVNKPNVQYGGILDAGAITL